jgi:hypothetical protein
VHTTTDIIPFDPWNQFQDYQKRFHKFLEIFMSARRQEESFSVSLTKVKQKTGFESSACFQLYVFP